MRRIAGLLAVLAVFQFIAWIIPATPGCRGIANYLPLHSLMETISIVIAMMVFAVGWNSHAGKTPGNLVLLACLFFAVGLLDFSHAASYGGMPDFFSPNDSDKHLNFWIVARLLAASALLIVTLRPWEREISLASKYSMFVTLVVATGLLNWVVIDSQDMLPDLFIPGQGLTPLKKSLEYLCITINVVTLLLLWVKMRTPQSCNPPGLFAAAGVLAGLL
jgi:hypothetical protein